MEHLDYAQPAAQLLTLGRLDAESWPDYTALGIGPEQIGDLVRMVQDAALWDAGEGAEAYAPIHAWRALGQLGAEEAIVPLLGLLWHTDEHEDDWVSDEIPVVLGMIGPAAIPGVSAYLADRAHGTWARAAAGSALAEIAERYPGARDACLAALTATMEGYAENDPGLNGCLVADLIHVRGVEAAPAMEAAFAADAVDEFVAGDWEDVQIELGLLTERKTPRPDLLPLLGGRDSTSGFPLPVLGFGRRPARRADKERKAKRKQQKETRRKQRKRRK